MKRYEVYKCRRQALGLTREQLSEIIDVRVGVIERYESGEMVPRCFEMAIRQAIDDEFTAVDRMTHYKRRILELGIQLNYEQETERILHDIGHMMVELGKMQMEIMDNIL